MTVQFTVPGPPVAKGRPRFHRASGRTYTPEKTVRYEDTVRTFASQAMAGNAPMQGPLLVAVAFWVTVPSSWSKKRQQEAIAGEIQPTKKPDLDNCVKAIKDALNGIVWRDDSQVVTLRLKKRYSDTPRTEVVVRQVEARAAP
jgi:Holliday junction resolvase RusA-like endonuclease